MILHLDTHVVVWLYAGEQSRFPPRALAALDHSRLVYSPAVRLELSFLHEIQRIQVGSQEILSYLRDTIGLVADETPYLVAVSAAESLSWARDPFDRLITGAASAGSQPLLTKDEAIRRNYADAVWDDE